MIIDAMKQFENGILKTKEALQSISDSKRLEIEKTEKMTLEEKLKYSKQKLLSNSNSKQSFVTNMCSLYSSFSGNEIKAAQIAFHTGRILYDNRINTVFSEEEQENLLKDIVKEAKIIPDRDTWAKMLVDDPYALLYYKSYLYCFK